MEKEKEKEKSFGEGKLTINCQLGEYSAICLFESQKIEKRQRFTKKTLCLLIQLQRFFSLYGRLKLCSADFSRVLTFKPNHGGDCSTPGGVNFQPLLTCNLYYSTIIFNFFKTKETVPQSPMASKCIERKVVLLLAPSGALKAIPTYY